MLNRIATTAAAPGGRAAGDDKAVPMSLKASAGGAVAGRADVVRAAAAGRGKEPAVGDQVCTDNSADMVKSPERG